MERRRREAASAVRAVPRLLLRTFKEWRADNPSLIAAGLSYFSIFSLAPLILVAIAVTAQFFRASRAESIIFDRIAALTTPETARSFQTFLDSMGGAGASGIVGLLLLAWAASRVVAHSQQALNIIWGPAGDPLKGWHKWAALAVNRLRAVALAVLMAFFLLLFFVTDLALARLQDFLLRFIPETLVRVSFPLASLVASTLVFTLLFAMLYKWLPARKIAWPHAWAGALLSSILFTVGRYGLLMYFRFSDLGSPAGAAGSIVLMLLWVYFSAHIFLIGAEFTWVFAHRRGVSRHDDGGPARPRTPANVTPWRR